MKLTFAFQEEKLSMKELIVMEIAQLHAGTLKYCAMAKSYTVEKRKVARLRILASKRPEMLMDNTAQINPILTNVQLPALTIPTNAQQEQTPITVKNKLHAPHVPRI